MSDNPRPSNRGDVPAVILGIAIGAGIWMASPWVTGHKEPWDAQIFYYAGALLAGGFVSGLLVPKALWAHYFGAVAGQLFYQLAFMKIGPLLVIGAAFLLAYSLLYLCGALIGSRARGNPGDR
jgi:hypothetical protein